MNRVTKTIIQLLPLLFGLVVYIFFEFYYRYHLHYQEQLQMFLFKTDYWSDLMSRPGGLADYMGSFFTQFFYYSWLGALIIASLLVILQQQVCRIANKMNQNLLFWPLTFIPSVLFWGLLCDENFLLAGLIAAMLTLLAVQLYSLIKKPMIRIFFGILMLIALYWLVGGIFWIFGALCLVLEWGYFKQLSKTQWIIISVSYLLCIVLPPLVIMQYLQYPFSRLWWGISYNRYPVVTHYPFLIIWLFLIFIPFIFKFLPWPKIDPASVKLKKNNKLFYLALQVIFIIVLANTLIRLTADWNKETIMSYDYHVRIERWDKVIAMANRKDPDAPLSVACLNLALSKDGKMGDCLFRYFQNGPEGLLPTFQRDFTLPFIAGEIYYHLGFLNTAMRYAFEAMEAIPDYKKSSRAIKRLAEVNLLNGENKVAAKYLHLLQYTLFYKNWATQTLKCVDNEKLIDQNPEWATLRKYRFTEDFLFSEQEKDQMLGLLFAHCLSNKMAYEYLMAYTLLTKDLDHFVQYFPIGKKLGYKEIPAHYQEALILAWASKSPNINDAPWPINPAIKQSFTRYAEIVSANQSSDKQLYEAFSQTYWYYFQYRK
jgi:hypothetical protein